MANQNGSYVNILQNWRVGTYRLRRYPLRFSERSTCIRVPTNTVLNLADLDVFFRIHPNFKCLQMQYRVYPVGGDDDRDLRSQQLCFFFVVVYLRKTTLTGRARVVTTSHGAASCNLEIFPGFRV